jgi:hypothetical protein
VSHTPSVLCLEFAGTLQAMPVKGWGHYLVRFAVFLANATCLSCRCDLKDFR